ncbi:MAG: amidohydrolase [Bacteroidota bacterium]
MQDIAITLIQAELAWKDKEKNLSKFSGWIADLTTRPDLIVLPEMFNTGFVVEPAGVAESMDGIAMQWLAMQAKSAGCAITGSLAIAENGKYYNRLIWMQPDGNYEFYDKRHLFRMGNEHERFDQGNSRLIVDLCGWKIMPLICYDLRFPVWSKNTLVEGKYAYDCLIYIANWPASRSLAFRSLLVARAIENQVYLTGVNRTGEDGNGVAHSGESAIIDFRGNYLAQCPKDKEHIITFTLSWQALEEQRRQFAVGLDWDKFTIE